MAGDRLVFRKFRLMMKKYPDNPCRGLHSTTTPHPWLCNINAALLGEKCRARVLRWMLLGPMSEAEQVNLRAIMEESYAVNVCQFVLFGGRRNNTVLVGRSDRVSVSGVFLYETLVISYPWHGMQ